MSFKEYLTNKKIDADAYKASEPDQWLAFATIFEQMHPKSFTLQKLNLINGIRRQFPYKEEVVGKEQVKPKTARPMMKPKAPSTGDGVADAMKKPIIKPKTSAAKPNMGKPVMKPKMARPVIKPKPKNPSE